ncbi:cyclic nucleotide-binding domain-containing protein [Pseudomonas lalucatii]|uniref:Cyclic nucleotide-binding domain-containing protein n=1 Tax=Pseudomonas lalucatii TaxID=1424203 RepID=A0ABS5PXS9_9PSED|nr:cyclic nucleotide-binding domain-containing protein [Pseudomonas lalucatii]MBS7661307.1 cyclic nucleotide-binding domain-containing protein [Pseudomonas lalucatii]MBS7691720.1 cyclic nucleotide-binding domain-containing protein [Pseudomonas lalucatii]MBS7724172.1 cyclic nucleotide-binding domain-containing protein [Pseudomonas lalucatii]QVM87827.1 cyclic nucleotide-binding domain-containing protein [Pseudomonas lalucatii]
MPDNSHLIDEIRDMLLDCGMFHNLLPAELLNAAGYFNISQYDPDAIICSEGDAGSFMCIIHFGAVSIRKTNSSGEIVELAKLRRGRAFGEMAVLDGERRSASCVAVSDCTLLVLAKDSLERMLQEAPKSAAKIIRAIAVAMSKRLRMVDGQMVEQQL